MKERLDQSGNEVTELVTRTSVSLNRMASPKESSLNPTAEEFFPSPVEVKVTATLHYLFSTTAHRSTRPSSPPGPASSGPCSSLGCRRLWRERPSSRMLMRRLFRRFFTTSTPGNSLKTETEKVNASEVKVAKLKKDLAKLKKSNEKVLKEKVEAAKEALDENNKLRKKIEAQKQKAANLELEKAKLESKSESSSGGLFQDMMDNFRELAETQLECAVCSELFVEATSINCGHTFCHYCIHEWKKKKSNCPVCRMDIKQMAQCKVLDEYTDKVYEQFVSEGGKLARASLKEERNKIKLEAEAAANQGTEARRVQAERRNEENLESYEDSTDSDTSLSSSESSSDSDDDRYSETV